MRGGGQTNLSRRKFFPRPTGEGRGEGAEKEIRWETSHFVYIASGSVTKVGNQVQDDNFINLKAHSPSLYRKIGFTLAEVFSPHFVDYRKAAFTLAEVLITLGIIGVVAALTMPTLIAKHEKKVLVTKMKYTYSVMSNAFLMARQDYGDPSGWDWSGGVTMETLERIVQTYIAPYLTKMSEGKVENIDRYFIRLKNGITLLFMLDGTWDTSKGEEGKKEGYVSTIYILASMKNKTSGLLGVDRDYSRDDFVMVFSKSPLYKSDRLEFFNWGGDTRDGIKNTSQYACNNSVAKNSRLNCGALIQYDGWEIKDDYPW